MNHTPVYIYVWLAYHIIFIAAWVLRKVRPINIVTASPDSLVYNPFYYYARKLFTILFCSLACYLVFIKWILHWRIDSWYFEVTIVFITFCLGHIVFIISKTKDYTDAFTKFRKPYIAFSLFYISLFYVRVLLAIVSAFSYNVHSIAYFFPDIRHNDLYLFKDYYLSYSETKDIVIEKKCFVFSKDVADRRHIANAICFREYQFAADMDHPELNPFPYAKRGYDNVVLLTNGSSGSGNGYVDFRLDSSGNLKITGYQYTFPNNDAKAGLQYVPCGSYILK